MTFPHQPLDSPVTARDESVLGNRSPYDRVFWLTYVANSALMIGITLLFRYSDFIKQAGGTEWELGWVVGIGTVGALVMRVFQGAAIDRLGPRIVWISSLTLYIVSLLAHLFIRDVHGPAVYLVRFLFMTSLAGTFGASITFMSLRVPKRRMAEMIGTLGSSGFVGMAIGPTLGDLVFGTGEIGWLHVQRMFLLSASMGVVSIICATLATQGHIRRPLKRRPPSFKLVLRYNPGIFLLAAIAVGWGVGVSGTFLRPYAEGLGIAGIRTFFLAYAITAFATRIYTRRWPEYHGTRPMLLIGFGCMTLSMLLYLVVQTGNHWSLILPGMAAGMTHAFLFPSVTAGGCSAFPTRYRGLATTVMTGMFDIGNLVGQPALGGIIEISHYFQLPAYPTLFISMAVSSAVFGLFYAYASRPRAPNEPDAQVMPAEVVKRTSKVREGVPDKAMLK